MTVTYQDPVRIDATAFLLRFSSDVAVPVPFRVYVDRLLVREWDSTSQSAEYVLTVGANQTPFIEVLDKACDIPQLAFPGKVTLHWLREGTAVEYRIEELVSAVWTDRGSLFDNGEPSYTWDTRWLEDVTTHQFRVIAIDAAGNEGTATTYSVQMVRHPDPPNVTYAYNGSGTPTVTITEA